jgi:hypothetical protein
MRGLSRVAAVQNEPLTPALSPIVFGTKVAKEVLEF